MPTVVGIRFKKAAKIYYFDPVDSGVEKGDFAIVETARGVEYGEVVIGSREVSEDSIVAPLKPVMRKATPEDAEKLAEIMSDEEKAQIKMDMAIEKAVELVTEAAKEV